MASTFLPLSLPGTCFKKFSSTLTRQTGFPSFQCVTCTVSSAAGGDLPALPAPAEQPSGCKAGNRSSHPQKLETTQPPLLPGRNLHNSNPHERMLGCHAELATCQSQQDIDQILPHPETPGNTACERELQQPQHPESSANFGRARRKEKKKEGSGSRAERRGKNHATTLNIYNTSNALFLTRAISNGRSCKKMLQLLLAANSWRT